MSRREFDPEAETFAELTRRTLVVIDVETTKVKKVTGADKAPPQRLVAYAYAVLEDGVYSRKQAYNALVNPGVPIHKDSTTVHGITDADVASKRDFTFHAKRLVGVLSQPGAVLVAHNANFDVGVLTNEFALIGQAMPDLPVIDTMYLPKTVSYAVEGLSVRPSLPLLSSVLGVTLRNHHDADADVEATAKVLLALLRHAAGVGSFTDIDDLLFQHARGTTQSMKSSGYISSRDLEGLIDLPADHLARHQVALDSDPDKDGCDEWVARSVECAQLLCPLLAAECEAARTHVNHLFKPLRKAGTGLVEPGQYATLVGGLMRLMTPAAWPRLEVWWWRNERTPVSEAVRCEGRQSCPDCRKGDPCPLDVAHEYAAASALCTNEGEVTSKRTDGLIFKGKDGYFPKWAKSVPELAAHLAWLVIADAVKQNQQTRADYYTGWVTDVGLGTVEPRIALRTAWQLTGQGRVAEARGALNESARTGSTNPGQRSVRDALRRLDVHEHTLAARTPAEPVAPNKSRPRDRVRTSPFSVLR